MTQIFLERHDFRMDGKKLRSRERELVRQLQSFTQVRFLKLIVNEADCKFRRTKKHASTAFKNTTGDLNLQWVIRIWSSWLKLV